MFETSYKELSKLEQDIFNDVLNARNGIGDKEIANMAKKYEITTKKVEEILTKLEKDGYLESEDD